MKKTQIILLFLVLLALKVSAQIDNNFLDDLREPPNPFTKSRIFEYFNEDNINPGDYQGYYKRGLLNLENGFYLEAIQNFRHLIIPQQDIVGGQSEFAEPYFYIGICKSLIGDYDSAMYFYNKTIEIDILFIEAYNERGILYLSRGDYKKALEDFEFSYLHNRQSANTLYNIGYCHFLLGDDRMAKKVLKYVMKDFPDFYRSHFLYGYINMLSGDYKNAKKYYSKAVDLNPDDPQTYLNKGLNLAWMGVLNNDVGYIEEAYTDMQHALQIDSTQANAYLASFYMKLLLNQPDAALENLYMAKAYMLNNSLLMAKATPYELEEYYLLSKIYSDSLIPYKEKNLAKIYFITFYMYKEKLDVKPILTYLKCTPSSLYINRLLAYHYLSIEDDGKFENALNIVLMLDGTLLHLTSIRAEKMIDKGNVEHGYKLFEILIRNSPDYAYLSYILGSKYLENGDLKNAIFYLDNAIRIAPDYKLAYVDRSLANANKGNYRAALNDALKLLMVEERRSYPWYVAGFACNHLNEPDSAINYLNIALQLSPGFESAYKEKAKSYIKLGDFESAMEVYEIIIDSLDNPAVGYYYSGKLLQDYMESPDKALEAFNKAKDLDSRNSRYHEAIGDVYNYDKGEFQMAIDNYKTAMSFSSENISLYIKTSKAFQQLNDYSSALLYLENALVNDYRNSSVWYQMGYVNYKMKKLETANNCFLKAINYDSNNADAYYAAGSIFWYFSEYNNCLKYSKVAFELDGENCRALLNIALAQLRLGNLEEAERLFKEYLEKIINVEDYDINESIKGVKIFIEENIMADDAKKILKDYFGVDE